MGFWSGLNERVEKTREAVAEGVLDADRKISELERRTDLTPKQREAVARAREKNDRVRRNMGL